MEYRYRLETWLSSKSFKDQQLLFERQVLQAQIDKCHSVELNSDFKSCVSGLKNSRKQFRAFVMDLRDSVYQEIREQMHSGCS